MNRNLDWKGPAIETRSLTKFYGTSRGVEDLDMTVEQGEIFGFLGPNGAGKTTTIRLVMDLIRPTGGYARVFGMDARLDSVAIKKIVGYLPGELALWDKFTGRQILTYLGNLRGGVPFERVTDLAERLQLDLDRKFREYSKGNKQKVGLIQAFMHEPNLLILDEPTAGLDPLNQQVFFQMAAEARRQGATIFLSSHMLSEVEHTCDRVGIIREGQLIRVGQVRDVISEKHYRIELQLSVPADETIMRAFASLPGIDEMEAVPEHSLLRFVAHGSMDPVIKLAAHYPVITMTSHEPTLEEAFLSYYGSSVDNQEGYVAPLSGPTAGSDTEAEKEAVSAG